MVLYCRRVISQFGDLKIGISFIIQAVIVVQSQSSTESSDEEEHDWIRMYLCSLSNERSICGKTVEKIIASKKILLMFSRMLKSILLCENSFNAVLEYFLLCDRVSGIVY